MDTAMITEQIRKQLAGPSPLEIVQVGDPVLRRPAADVPADLDRGLLAELLAAMRECMHAAPGVGLAAPQIGLGLRLAVLEDAAEVSADVAEARERRPLPYTVIINPHYRQIGHDTALWYEGCLSVPGLQAATERAVTVELRCLDEDLAPVCERFTGWQARIVQHETDHTDGILYLDQAVPRSLTDTTNYLAYWGGADLQPARTALGF
ncbi:peptide deformylase [Microlunatus elymi]|uniref:Peptide deformylase n=1 Tax=Microlunatus elymi TaxID=2596828 RepID=A0A516PY52_9ACTN|nr:peptide deformylase [Microlunatus elymi]QDP96103.1 peptide deformylase [Microlunatus elymi]